MTVRRRKRGGHHFALTCDTAGCAREFNEPIEWSSVSSMTLREYAKTAGWAVTREDKAYFDPIYHDWCPEHLPQTSGPDATATVHTSLSNESISSSGLEPA